MTKLKQKIDNLSDEEFSLLLNKLASDEYFMINSEELKKFEHSFKETVNGFDAFELIDTNNIEPLNYPIKNSKFYLRSDAEIIELDANKWLDTQTHDDKRYIDIKYEK